MSDGGNATTREEEFLRLFAGSQRRLHAYILALVFDANAAADILQETNIVLWQKFEQFEPGTNFFAWAREIARIAVLRYRQKSSTRISSIDPGMLEQLALSFADDASSGTDHRRDALDTCLKNLASGDRDLILSRYASGATVSGIAQQLDRTANSVSQSLRRIRRMLLECTERRLRSGDHVT